jgi:glycosyltransferase involved in cell wall biosynthesis
MTRPADTDMNLYFVTFHYGDVTNGPGRFADYFVRYVSAHCPSVELTVVSGDSGESKCGERVVRLRRSRRRGSTLHTALRIDRYLRKEIGRGNVDAVYFNSPNHTLFPPDNVKTYINFNDYYNARFRAGDVLGHRPYESLYKCFWRIVEKRHCRTATKVFVNSRFTGRAIEDAYGVDPRKVVVTYKAVDPARFGRRSGEAGDRPCTVAFIGTDYRRKGLVHAMGVVRRLVDALDCDCEFNIVGRYGPGEMSEILRMIRTNRISRQTTVWSESIDAGHVLARSDFLLLPAEEEAFGVVILEALASGVLVIASNVGGIPEIISHGKDGLLFESSDEQGMARAIHDLCRDREARREMIENGMKRSRMFSVQRICSRIISEMESDAPPGAGERIVAGDSG